ncbi:MAG: tetratricopeptide repeat protein [Candidatus Adiutrix sp.]|nr:tetratricopeptide repeat protein [Candidatus Adiutrix sp.]
MDERLKEIESLFSEGRAREALDLLQRFLEEAPENVRAWNDLGAILQALGQSEAAEEAFRRAVALAPDRRDSRSNLALALAAHEKWGEAREQIQKLLAENQNDDRLWIWLAKIEQSTGNPAAAADYLDRALTLRPDQPELRKARDKLAAEAASPETPAAVRKPTLLMCCQKSLEHFAFELCDELEKYAVVRRVVGDNFGSFHGHLNTASTIWLDWGTEMAVAATKQPRLLHGKKVILRLHSFEILNRLAGQINYEAVSDVVFVSHYLRRIFERLMPGRLTGRRVHVIHNGIKLERFPFIPGKGRRKIAVVGKLDAKKDPMLTVQAFAFLLRRHPELELHVAGGPDDNRYYLSLPDFLAKNNLGEKSNFYGHVKDIPGWLADKDFILCTSPFESQGVGLLEAMHRGLRPLIYNFPGAESLYPAACLWNDLDGLEALLLGGPAPEDCRDFVAEKYSMERQALNFLKVVTGREPVVEEPPVPPIAGPA